MQKSYQLALYIFRRDLRLSDNTALIEALRLSKEVMPCFIFDDRQVKQNSYKSDNAIQFMTQSLHELNQALITSNAKLYFFSGIAEKIIASLVKTYPIDAIFVNRDYTPFSLARDKAINEVCEKANIAFHAYSDSLLHEPGQVLKPDNKPYTVFTHYFNKAKTYFVAEPQKNNFKNYFTKVIAEEDKTVFAKYLQYKNPNILLQGGRKEGLQLLKKLSKLNEYKLTRDIPSQTGTSHLSAHHKFGTISIRESYQAICNIYGPHHTLINELHWRDFFTQIAYYFPFVFERAFNDKYQHIAWSKNEKKFQAWCQGRTGFPIVDAGMRELNSTGFMHNRVRMITASFLTKDLHINWQWGEQYFAQKLIDYDPCVNNGNWQWAASTGCDAQPYFRIFNPWLQQKKYDPDCLYIKTWIPELAKFEPKIIHGLEKGQLDLFTNYPTLLVDHAEESKS